jgi:ferredoxin-NADP reductase
MLRYVADEGLPYRITLVYSNRDRESAAFLDELEELERRIAGLRVLLTMTDDPAWAGETRHLDASVLAELVDGLEGKTFLVAGPPAMAEAVADSLRGAGVPEERVLSDGFSGY